MRVMRPSPFLAQHPGRARRSGGSTPSDSSGTPQLASPVRILVLGGARAGSPARPWPNTSSSCTTMTADGVRARKRCTASIRSTVIAARGASARRREAAVRARARAAAVPRSRVRAASCSASRCPRRDKGRSLLRAAMSRPAQKPASVGRSCVPTVTSACARISRRAARIRRRRCARNTAGGTTALPPPPARRARSSGNGAQVLADDEAAVALAFECDDAEQVGERIAHVGAVDGRRPRGHPEQAHQPHHVIDAQRAGVAHVRAQRRDEGRVACRLQTLRQHRRQAPVLSAAD